ncbi:MAG: hypothetical protein VB099_05105 [Candidatus Limiplasma sp.]|nr:hypothetical protein [Candidatus Limiplasma sp.]
MKNRAFRLITVLLAWMMVWSMVFSAQAAMVVSGSYESIEEDPSQSVESAAVLGDSVYVLTTSGTIGRFDPATRETAVLGSCVMVKYSPDPQSVARMVEEAGEGQIPLSWLFSDGEKLYGLCAATGEWFTLLDDGGAYAPVKMDSTLSTKSLLQELDGAFYAVEANGLFARAGFLYYTATVYEDSLRYRAGRINLQTGEDRPFATPNINELIPWKNGKLLAMIFDQMKAFTSASGEPEGPQYGLLDPETDVFTVLGGFPQEKDSFFASFVNGICGNPQEDTLYYTSGGRIMGLNVSTGETRVSAYSGEGMMGGYATASQAQWVNGYYVKKSPSSGLLRYELDSPALAQGALRIYGEMGSAPHRSFLQKYPDIPVDVATDYTISLEDLTSAMVSGSDAYDVLLLTTGYMPVRQLVDKGYATDLSGYPEIMSVASQMEERFLAQLQKDGKLYAAPIGISSANLTVDMESWESLGLTQEDLPTTYAELFDFFANWEADYMDDFPDMKLMAMEPYKLILFSVMLNDYLSYLQANGMPLGFNTPAFRSAMTAFEAIEFEAFGQETDPTRATVSYMDQGSFLFGYGSSVGEFTRRAPGDSRLLLLSFLPEEKPVIGVNTSVLLINPKSTRLEQAALYVAHYLNNLPETGGNIVLFPDRNEAVEDKGYADNKKSLEEQLAKQQALLQSAEESAKPEVQEAIHQLEMTLEDLEEYRFAVTAEQIQAYRQEQEPYLWINEQSVLYTSDTSEVNNLMMQYLDKAITLDQMIQGMDQRVRMMELEAQ